jgi:hypothetical protein
MRIVMIYPSPGKIAAPGDPLCPPRFLSRPGFALAVERRRPANPGPVDIDKWGFEGTRKSVSA